MILIGGLLERLPYLFMGLAVWAFASQSPTITLIAFFLLLAATALGNGIATPAWFTMIGKVLPVHRRGIFFGISGGLGALMGIIGAHFVGQILETVPYPDNYAWLFTIAFVFAALSWVGLALNREPESPVVKAQVPLTRYLRQLPAVLRTHHNYRRFLLSYAVSRLGAMAVGFFLVFGNTRYSLTGTQVGLLTAILIGSQAVMNVVWGWVGDRAGHKIVLTASAFTLTAAALIAWASTSEVGLIVAFVLLGAAIASDNVSKFNIVLEFARARRSTDLHRPDQHAAGPGGGVGADPGRLAGDSAGLSPVVSHLGGPGGDWRCPPAVVGTRAAPTVADGHRQ